MGEVMEGEEKGGGGGDGRGGGGERRLYFQDFSAVENENLNSGFMVGTSILSPPSFDPETHVPVLTTRT